MFQDLGTTGQETHVLNQIFRVVIDKYSKINATPMKVDNNGMPLFTLPKKAYNLKIKVDKDPNRRCNKTQVTIMAQALIPSKECFPVI